MYAYEERLSLLLEQGVIQETTHRKVIHILSDLHKQYGQLQENTAFIMHLTMCIERVHSKEQLQGEALEKIEELKTCEQFDKGMEELVHIQELGKLSLNEHEKMYLLIHLMNLQP